MKWSDITNRQLYSVGEAYGSHLTFYHPGRPGDCQINNNNNNYNNNNNNNNNNNLFHPWPEPFITSDRKALILNYYFHSNLCVYTLLFLSGSPVCVQHQQPGPHGDEPACPHEQAHDQDGRSSTLPPH